MKRGTWLLAAAAVVLAGVAVWLEPTRVVWGTLRGEAFFAGRPTSYWNRGLAGDPAEQAEALQQLEHGRAAAVPVLTELLSDQEGTSAESRCIVADLLGKFGAEAQAAGPALLRALQDRDPYVRSVAAASLSKTGVPADQAVPALLQMLQGQQKRDAARALSDYRGAAAAAQDDLIRILQNLDLDSETRWNAARTLGKLGPAGRDAVPALIEALDDQQSTVREHAAEALGDIGPPAAEAVPALVAVLDDPAVRVRRDAVRSLGQLGEPARAAVPAIKQRMEDPEAMVRDAARDALRAIAPEELAAEANGEKKPKTPGEAADAAEPADER